jgi:RND family efflux transporter MFP subunit
MASSPEDRRTPRLGNVPWVVGLLIGFAITGYYVMHSGQARDQANPQRARRKHLPLPVRTVSVTDTKSAKVIGATCVTLPSQQAIVRSGASRGLHLFTESSIARPGIPIAVVHVREGQQVSKGELLFELESEDDRLIVEQWTSALEGAKEKVKLIEQTAAANAKAAQLEYDSAKASLEFRTTDFDTRTKLLEAVTRLYDRQAATALEFFGAQTGKADAGYQKKEAELRLRRATDEITLGQVRDALAAVQAIAERESARFSLKLAERDVSRCRVESPLDGYIGRVEVIPGQLVDSTATLTQVLKLNPLHVQMDFPQERTDEVALGQKAEIVLDSHPQQVLQATVVAISPQVSTDTRTLPVTLELINPNSRIKAGVSGFARLSIDVKVPTLPSTAIIEQGTRAVVFRVDQDRARLTEVKTGALVGNGLLEVRRGLNVGDEAVLFGQDALLDNDSVNRDWRRWSGRDQ